MSIHFAYNFSDLCRVQWTPINASAAHGSLTDLFKISYNRESEEKEKYETMQEDSINLVNNDLIIKDLLFVHVKKRIKQKRCSYVGGARVRVPLAISG